MIRDINERLFLCFQNNESESEHGKKNHLSVSNAKCTTKVKYM